MSVKFIVSNQNSIAFGTNISKISKEAKIAVKKEVKDFLLTNEKKYDGGLFDRNPDKIDDIYTRFSRPAYFISGLGASIASLIKGEPGAGTLFMTLSAFFREGAVVRHERAILDATTLVKILKKKGFNQKERAFGVKNFLSKDGCPVHSTWFNLFMKNDVLKLAKGEKLAPYFNSLTYKKLYKNRIEEKVKNS